MQQHQKNSLISYIAFGLSITFWIYHTAFSLKFANIDDQWMLLDNNLISEFEISINHFKRIFRQINQLQYSPVNTIYYGVIYLINGYNPFWYHAGSVLIHFFNAILIYYLLYLIFISFNVSISSITIFSIVLIWLIHPINVESVVWISASKVLLFTFFGVLSLIFLIKSYLNYSIPYYIIGCLFFCLSFLCKEQAVLIPLSFVAFLFFFEINEKGKVNWKNIILFSSLIIGLGILGCYITIYVSTYQGGDFPFDKYPFYKRLFFVIPSLYFYFIKVFIPIGLHYHYPFPIRSYDPLPWYYYVITILAVYLTYFCGRFLLKNIISPIMFFWTSFWLINLLLCIHLIPLSRASMLADRYMYLPSLGIITCFIYVVGKHIDKIKISVLHYIIISSIITAYLSLYSYQLILNWVPKNI